jgi:hypothetical protein
VLGQQQAESRDHASQQHGLAFVAAVQDLAAVGVEDEPAQFVEGLAAVELAADAAAEGFVGEPAQRVRVCSSLRSACCVTGSA